MRMPRITVVTPSYNQGRFLARTIDSVRNQGYPNVEHIVVDGMSSDDTPAILTRYPHLQVVREPDRGQAEAINKGFRRATGDIYCFLNSDDMLLPGALERVAREIDPARGRFVVFGRCCHVDEEDRRIHIEHPCGYVDHRRVLEIWKEHCIPQPATFWAAEVWRQCGPLNEAEPVVLDYDLFCRFSQRYPFHFVDQVLAAYRLHSESKTCTRDFASVYREGVRVSRKYWGPKTGRKYWQLAASLLRSRVGREVEKLELKRWAARLFDGWEEARREDGLLLGLGFLAAAAALAPGLVARRLLLHRLSAHLERWRPAPEDLWSLERVRPKTLAWRGYTTLHRNGCVGPLYVTGVQVGREHHCLEVHVGNVLEPAPWPVCSALYLDGQFIERGRVPPRGTLVLRAPLAGVGPARHEVRIESDAFIVPHDYLGNGDYRPLSLKVARLKLLPAAWSERCAQRRAA